ncbi:MAG: Hsp20 family protein [Pseudomonadales bacterium]|nr:Hsp20 family protein [Pseudomonadales bacterium]MCP5215635.1 Hsp20 family protein [Pseudomonadales bacterium]
MARLDLSPLFRSSVGFDHLASMLDSASRVEQPAYPPYNIERVGEDKYRITMAVAGFDASELDIESERNTLKVSAIKANAEEGREYLYRGIAARNFERNFQLADHVKVVGANLENGLLHIDLERQIPEAMKPRKIEISAETPKKLIENERASSAA